MNKRKIGNEKEIVACNYIENNGYRLVCHNYFCRAGEIDIIAYDRDVLCFIEVKYRKNGTYGSGADAVNLRKQRAISKVALFYLMKQGMNTDIPLRFDVVTIDDNKISLIKNAFEYCYR